MNSHTPTPWRVDPLSDLHVSNVLSNPATGVQAIHGNGLSTIVVTQVCGRDDGIYATEEHNAARIVACVNACEGIPNGALEGVNILEKLESILNVLENEFAFDYEIDMAISDLRGLIGR